MLKQTTFKLARSIFGASLIGVIITVLIVSSIGGLGSKPTTNSSSSSLPTTSSSSQVSSSSAASSSLTSSTANKVVLPTSTGGLITTIGGQIFLCGLSVLIIFLLVYNSAWQEGNKDPNRIQYGHMKKFMAKGLVAGLLSTIPYVIYTTAFLIVRAVASGSGAFIVMNIIYRFLNMQYFVFNDAWINMPVVCYLILLLYPLASTIGYIAGFKGIIIASKIIYKNKNNKRQDKLLTKMKR